MSTYTRSKIIFCVSLISSQLMEPKLCYNCNSCTNKLLEYLMTLHFLIFGSLYALLDYIGDFYSEITQGNMPISFHLSLSFFS